MIIKIKTNIIVVFEVNIVFINLIIPDLMFVLTIDLV